MPHDLIGCRRSRHADLAGDFTIPGASAHYPPDLGLEPRHLDITLDIDIPAETAEGEVITTVVANRQDADSITLEACDLEDVAVRDLAGRALSFRHDGKQIKVRWHEPFAAGEERKLGVAYRVERPIDGLCFSSPDSHDPDRAQWVATDHETERARYWLPCIDFPAVRTTLAIHLTAAADLTILAAGLLESEEDHGDGRKTANWRLDYPCPSYLICFAIGDFVRADDRSCGDIGISYFAAKGRASSDDLMRSFGRTPEIMEWLTARVGQPFPFPKYYQFALPAFGGAMENISLVSWDDLYVADAEFHRDIGDAVDGVNVHEMAHSYFGDAVVIRDYAHAWLKESWATYLEICWMEDKEGADEQRHGLLTYARAYFSEADSSYMRPIVTRTFNSSWDMYDRHLYPGGACRLHMLRKLLGDEVFWPAVADYLGTYSRSTVETDDFRRTMEKHSGRSLGKWFDQWILGKGYPKLKCDFSHDEDRGEATLGIEQTQAVEKDKDGPGVFDLDLVIAWEDVDGHWHRRTVEIRERKHVFVLAMEKAPQQIRLDPDCSLLFKLELNPGEDMLRRALASCPDNVGRILAAEELMKSGRSRNYAAVTAAVRKEAHWGTRQEMVRALGKSKHASAIDSIVELLAHESDPRVQASLAEACQSFRDERIAEALIALLDRGATYRVTATALRSLGAQRGDAHIERLKTAATARSHRGLIESGALVGLARTRTEAGYEALAGTTARGVLLEDARPAAVASLARSVESLQPRFTRLAADELIDRLRDDSMRVRTAAAHALGVLGEASAIGAITAMKATLPTQERPRIDRVIQRIRDHAGGASKTAALKTELEELRDRSLKLEHRVATLEAKSEARTEDS